jgi:hypothetical protein
MKRPSFQQKWHEETGKQGKAREKAAFPMVLLIPWTARKAEEKRQRDARSGRMRIEALHTNAVSMRKAMS